MGFSPLDDKLCLLFRAFAARLHNTTRAPRTDFMVAWGMDDDVVDCASQAGRFM